MNEKRKFTELTKTVLPFLFVLCVIFSVEAYGQDNDNADKEGQPFKKSHMPIFVPGGNGGSFRRAVLDRTDLYLTVEGKLDDNIYRTSSNREMDLITTVSPEIRYSFEPVSLGRKEKIPVILTFEARFNFVFYKNNPQLDQQYANNLFTPTISAALDLDRLSVYFKGQSTLENRSDIDPDENNNNQRLLSVWDVNYGVNYTLGPKDMKLKVGYDHAQRLYFDDEYESGDRDSDRVYLRSTFGLPGGRQITATCDYNLTNFTKSGNGGLKNGNCWLGIGGPIGRKLSGTGNIGVGILSSQEDDGFGEFDLDRPIYDVGLSYRISKRSTLNLAANRNLGYGDTFSAGTASLDTDSLFYNDVPLMTDKVSIGVSYKPPLGLEKPDKLDITFKAQYRKVDYEVRGDDIDYEAHVGASYKVNKYCSVSGQYKLIKREESDTVSGYVDNQVILTLRLGY